MNLNTIFNTQRPCCNGSKVANISSLSTDIYMRCIFTFTYVKHIHLHLHIQNVYRYIYTVDIDVFPKQEWPEMENRTKKYV